METKLPTLLHAFLQRFLGGILKTAAEKAFDVLGLAVAALYAIFGKHANVWDAVTPLVWIVCAILGFHVVRAAVQVGRDDQPVTNSPLIVVPDKSRVVLPRSYSTKRLVAIAIICLFLLAVPAYLVQHIAAVETAPIAAPPVLPAPLDLAIFADCEMKGLPITIPPMSSIQVVPINEAYMRSNHWGSEEVRNEGPKPMKWPDKEKMDSAGRKHDPGVFGYSCTITDLGSVNVLDVAIPMHFWFGQEHGNDFVPFSPVLSPLNAGSDHAEHLYFVNDCPINAVGILPDSVTLQVIGEANRRRVTLNLPHRNPVEPVMMWFPTEIPFVGATKCK